jgi:tRNA threonylcarbamoyladenosine modification (KEOPS) complex  Pcc1 subunit
MPKVSAELTVPFDTPKRAQDAAAIIRREAEFKRRGGASVRINNGALTISMEADDLVALRAMMNAYMRALHAAGAVSEVLADRK